MSLVPGFRLGGYEIVARIGAGGMGEVYRARDGRLKRDVALKILPSSLASDHDRVARFEREAELLAALSHPNIAGIYGVEESGGTFALVMELVEGEDLALRLARGPMALDEALPIARQIADALEAAHERGIIHRDLKPANVKLRPDGTVKVLDFGLAKAASGPAASGSDAHDAAQSPTITSPAMTAAGVVLGTAAYMSPEQARGKPVDRRADIWAFGALMYEMLTGVRAFGGEDVTDTLAAILRSEPDWSLLPHDLPTSIDTLLRRCLEKDPRRRLSHLSIASFLLASEPAAVAHPVSTAERPRSSLPRTLTASAIALAAGAAMATAVTLWLARSEPPVGSGAPIRFTITAATGGETWRITTDRPLALSPDARALVYRGTASGFPRLFIRRLDALEPRALPSTELPRGPFFSPDGEWVGVFIGGELRKIPASGGPAVPIGRVTQPGGLTAGASWGDDDAIVLAVQQQSRGTESPPPGLMVIPASGGEPKALTTIDPQRGEVAHVFPHVLPGSRGVLFKVQLAGRGPSEGRLMVLDRVSGKQREIAPVGSAAEYVNGHVIYADPRGHLYALPFDLSTLAPTAAATPLSERVHVPAVGQPLFSTARVGGLAYIPASDDTEPQTARTLVWVDRQQREEPLPLPPRAYAVARLSPEGSQIALDLREQENDIWIWSTRSGALSRLTRGPTVDLGPVWTPDGRRVVWASTRESTNPVLFWQAADGTGAPERLTDGGGAAQFVGTMTPDGRNVLFYQGGISANSAIQRVSLDADHRVETVLRGPSGLATPEISSDGRWIAYSSDESGRSEIYVRPYPNVDAGRWQISSQGGTRPAWNRNGRELFFLDGTLHLSAAPISVSGHTLTPGAPRRLLEKTYYPGFTTRGLMLRGYDVSPDGQRFLMIKGNQEIESEALVTITLNWLPAR